MDNNENIIPANEYEARLEKLKQLQAQNTETFAYKGATLDFTKIIEDFDQLIANKSEVTFSGRLMSKRLHGGSLFADLVYNGQKIQIYFKQDEIGASLYQNFVDLYDVADFIEITGTPFITKRGEKTIVVKTYKLLTKTLLPLPEKWHGLKDIEIRFRKRYLDLLSNEETRKIFVTRSKVIEFIRSYMIKHDFLEVETPILQTIASGAIAKPFKTHHNALDTDMFLRIAPELYLKELLVGGFEKVFEIARCFRNEGLDTSHNPEFNQIEFYWAYKDYTFLIDFMEKFLSDLVKEIHNSQKITYAGQEIDFTPTYPRLDFRQALIDYAGIDLDEHDTASLLETAKKKGLLVESYWEKGKLADELYKTFVRPKLVQPTFIINHPIELSPLAKKIKDRPNYVERFQLVVAGKLELMNAFSELNDPIDQENRFKMQADFADKGDDEAMLKDDLFVDALKHGMPPAAGLGMGIERLIMLLTDQQNIKEVILFPTLKPENE